ncbi:ABC transporter substrate-binding protein [Fodinicurvata fenggangensis]|uniref:ABC transporter substrate-binding protein n=1 Tax=Fodinicurvata fenggangensis TaxID=1121830 RepID=UPI0004797607|nr:ABC transporter substrate-binding protein [Fodinicurvata fenggangensis]
MRRLSGLLAGLFLLFTSPSVHAQSDEPLEVLLDWFVNPDHAPLIVAQEKGFFEDAGIEVRFTEPADPNDPPKLVAAGRADLAVSYQPTLHIQATQGLPLARIATLVATPLNTLLALEEGPIKQISDLKGRKIGYSVGGVEEAVLGAMLERHDLTLDDVELVNVNFSLSPALMSGQVDAVIGAYRNFELNQLDIEGAQGRAFYVEEEGVPAYDELIVLAHSEKLDDPRLPAFVEAMERGVQYLVNHPQESWKLFAGYKDDLDDELNRRAWSDTLPRFALRPAAVDWGRYRRFAAFLEDAGIITDPPPLSDYVTDLSRKQGERP